MLAKNSFFEARQLYHSSKACLESHGTVQTKPGRLHDSGMLESYIFPCPAFKKKPRAHNGNIA